METLLAVVTLAIGMLFIGGTFMTGVYFASLSTERTIASVAADEAFAKIKLYGLDPRVIDPNRLYALGSGAGDSGPIRHVPYEWLSTMPLTECLYPSTGEASAGQYSWGALCTRMDTGGRLVGITVFVCRESSLSAKYWVRKQGADWPTLETSELPRAVRVMVTQESGSASDELQIVDGLADTIDERAFIRDGASIVDDETGQIYRVRERPVGQPDRVRLDRPWVRTSPTPAADGGFWVVPPPVTGGRDPLVAIYQQILRF
ncbi:MAG: hypothetical protein JW955_00850 [Sedimentisphaerales bacterium]|nr:hypothetical protein [Sedimentisphaerales bacterium]